MNGMRPLHHGNTIPLDLLLLYFERLIVCAVEYALPITVTCILYFVIYFQTCVSWHLMLCCTLLYCSLLAGSTWPFHYPCWWKGPWVYFFHLWWCVEEEEAHYVSSIQCTQNETGKWRHKIAWCNPSTRVWIVHTYIHASTCTWTTSEVKQNGMVWFYPCTEMEPLIKESTTRLAEKISAEKGETVEVLS